MELKPCGDCTACCSGQLMSVSYGNFFGKGKKCVFLVKEKCTIYDTRPDVCRTYQCAWTQGILYDEMRPDQCGLMVSVEYDKEGKQYLKAMEVTEHVPYESFQKLDECAKKLNTYWVKVKHNAEYNIHNQRGCGSCNSRGPCS
jgi:Fe-S-cluster containining protein